LAAVRATQRVDLLVENDSLIEMHQMDNNVLLNLKSSSGKVSISALFKLLYNANNDFPPYRYK